MSQADISRLTGYGSSKVKRWLDKEPMGLITPLEHFDLIPPPERDEKPKVLIYDIETAPTLGWVWSNWKTNVIRTHQDWYTLCIVYQWEGSDEAGFISITQDPDFYPNSPNDAYVIERIASLFDAADITVAHNNDKFDRRKCNARMVVNDIWPPSPYETVDTLKIAKRELANNSSALNELARLYGLEGKVQHTGFQLWLDCMAGDEDAWALMEEYNRQDVVLLAQVFEKLRPWAGLPGKPKFPNYNHYADEERYMEACSKCGSQNTKRRGYHRTVASVFRTIQCNKCGAYSRLRMRESRKNQLPAV